MKIRPRWLAATATHTAERDAADALQGLADACVPAAADACFVDLVTRNGELRRVASALATGAEATHPVGDAVARTLLRALPGPDDGLPGLVLAGGAPQLVARVTDPQRLAATPTERAAYDRLAPRSALLVPIPARPVRGTGEDAASGDGRVRPAGVLTLVLTRPDAAYDADSLADAQELAAQVGLLLDHQGLERRVREATRARSEFLAIVSHELRTPLNIILGYTELMLNGIPSALGGRTSHQVERIRASARYLLQRIEEVLAYARLEGGRESARVEPLRLSLFVRDLAELIAPLAEAKRLEIEIAQTPDIEMHTDATHLRQILLHLLTNAVRFTEAGKVGLSVAIDRDTVRFLVSDTGRGLAEREIERIFDPFWQADPLATRRAQGTGLGLSIARRLAHLLGGEIGCRSEVGVGSTFTLRVPLRAAPA